ncbi:MAG TPA: alginate lyase family protein [Pyrinomonadaceae bacterium]
MKRALRGEVDARTVALEALRRSRARAARRRERSLLPALAQAPARLRPEFARLSQSELLAHFRSRAAPKFFPGCDSSAETSELQRSLFPFETAQLLEKAARIAREHCWTVLGYGEKCFGERINWLCDPLSGVDWPLDYHGDVRLLRGDGSDARVLWEVNRLAHLLTLARAGAVTGDEKFAREIFAQLASWREQNPLGRGPNWSCAMEVALRAMNLLTTFNLLRDSSLLDEETLPLFLQTFDQHGAHIRRNLEFSYISTSNHYLSDVTGLFWLGLMLPELEAARGWRELGWRELLREMDKQVLADGADDEASTGYHRFVLELFLYSFVLARANEIEIHDEHWRKLRLMLEYTRALLRPDGRAPLIGDTDGGQVLPFRKRAADDHAYVLALGALFFDEPRLKQPSEAMPEELLWIFGREGVRAYESFGEMAESAPSQAFERAGTYVMRADDLYLLFNASGSGLKGRGSHGHNDALSLEVSACGTCFITDPGTYVYSADFHERHLFRSTQYHSTLEVDAAEQNSTDASTPFVIGDEAHPRVTHWETNADFDLVTAEHDGYRRLAQPITHRRSVRLHKRERFWLVEDELVGDGEHELRFRFHFAEELDASMHARRVAQVRNRVTGARLFVVALDVNKPPEFEPRFVSRDYGSKSASISACWTVRAAAPCRYRWALVPVCAGDDESERLSLIERFDMD